MPGGTLTQPKNNAVQRISQPLLLPGAVLLATLALTLLLSRNALQDARHVQQAEFSARVNDIDKAIRQRIASYQQVLYGARAFAASHARFSPQEFHNYVDELHIAKNYPGVQEIGFIPLQTKSENRVLVSYIDPVAGPLRFVAESGLPGSQENVAAMEKARDLDQPVISGKPRLVQNSGKDATPGFLMFLPVYRPGSAHDTPTERRAHIKGWLAADIRVPELMAAVLGREAEAAGLGLDVYDGDSILESSLIFQSARAEYPVSSLFSTNSHLDIGGRDWQLRAYSLPTFDVRMDKSGAIHTAAYGVAISLLLTMLAAFWTRSRKQAGLIAEHAKRELLVRETYQQALAEDKQRWKFALRLSEAKLHTILDHAPIGIWLVGTDGRYQFVNKTFCDAVGAPEHAFITAQKLSDVLPPENAANCIKSDLACLASQTLHRSEETLTFVDGKPHVLTINKVPLKNDAGEIIGVIGTALDITEQRAHDLALKKSEEQYRLLMETALSIILRWDTRGHILYVNRYAEELFGYRPGELIGKHVVGTIVPETESTSRDLSGLMKDILAHPENFRLNINENIKKNGEHIWVMWTNRSVFDEQGNLIEVLSIGHDISDLKRAEIALHNSEARYREFFELAEDLLFHLDLESKFTVVNHALIKASGYTQEELVGAPLG